MEFRLLGPLELLSAGQALRLGGARLPAMVATLLLNANETVSVEHLARVLWLRPPRAADSNIRTYVAQLRGRFAAAGEAGWRLTTGSSGYRLEVRPGELDLAVFNELVADGQHALDHAERDVALDRLRRALNLWRGEPLTGVTGGPQLAVEAAQLEERRLDVAERWAEAALAAGRPEDAATELTRIVSLHPLREQFWVQLMLAQYRSGRPGAALAAYREAYRVLDQELGIRPSRPLQQLHQQILNADPALDQPTGRTATMVTAAPRPRQLPADLASFAGRTEQLRVLDALMADREARRPGALTISVITGTAGVGKTALAVHWAHRVARLFPDGQLYANLRGFDPAEPAVDPAEVVRGFLDALGVPPERVPVGLTAQAALYRSLVADREMLVVLDNARDAEQVRPLLPGSGGCLVVVTSRNELSGLVAAEGAHPLGLDLLPVAEARDMLARRLGTQRVADEPEAVERIITRCARLPLALSVVAARAVTRPGFPLAAVAAELHGEADSPTCPGDAHLAAGQPAAACTARRLALTILDRLGHPDAREVRLRLLDPDPPPAG